MLWSWLSLSFLNLINRWSYLQSLHRLYSVKSKGSPHCWQIDSFIKRKSPTTERVQSGFCGITLLTDRSCPTSSIIAYFAISVQQHYAFILAVAISKYSFVNSIPINSLFNCFATTPVVPVPINGSNITLYSLENANIN